MNDLSYKNWSSMSDKVILQHIGSFIKQCRLRQNKTQALAAQEAGISRSTLGLLERGETVTLATFIQVLRVLNQLQIMEAFTIKQSISPLALAKLEKEKRIRASGGHKEKKSKTDW